MVIHHVTSRHVTSRHAMLCTVLNRSIVFHNILFLFFLSPLLPVDTTSFLLCYRMYDSAEALYTVWTNMYVLVVIVIAVVGVLVVIVVVFVDS